MSAAEHACLLCGAGPDRQSVRAPTVYGGEPFQRFWHCAACDAIYLFPPTTDDDDLAFYEADFDRWMETRSGDESWSEPSVQFERMQARELPLRLPWLERYAQPGMRALDIGSSSGFTLAPLQKMGLECVGVEVSTEYAAYANDRLIKTYASLDDVTAAGEAPFDLVLHYYVLEHVTRPLEFLEEALSYRAVGGKMIFEVPNGNDPLISLYKVPEFEEFYWWRAHHWYFTPKSLSWVLDRLGRPYELHPAQRYDLSNHLVWALTGKPGGMGRYDHIFSEQTKRSYAEDLKRSEHHDHIVAIVS
jgi:2-polyprenyl-3-methyl-5-hydroxy-6-metoxy-1,4-benzoquinol methylase